MPVKTQATAPESVDEMLHRMAPLIAYVKASLAADGSLTRHTAVMRDGSEFKLKEEA